MLYWALRRGVPRGQTIQKSNEEVVLPQKLTDVREPVNALFYGDGGTGKTTALASMANLGPVLIVNAESGVKGKALARMGVDISNIEIFPAEGEELTWSSLEAQWLRVREELNKDPDAYVGVVWDPVSEIQKVLVEAEAAGAVARAEARGVERSVFVKDRDNWNVANDQLRSLIRKYRDLPCHFGMSALTRREQDDDGAVTYQPNVTPSMQNDLVGWMDVVCATSVALVDGEEEYRGLFRPHSKFRGKDRFKILPKWLVDPTFDRVVAYVDEELAVDDDPVMVEARKRAEKAKTEQAKAKA